MRCKRAARVTAKPHPHPLLGVRQLIFGVDQNSDSIDVGDEFAQKLKSFCGESSRDKRRPSDVAAGPVKACDEAIGDRVATICEYYWNRAGGRPRTSARLFDQLVGAQQ